MRACQHHHQSAIRSEEMGEGAAGGAPTSAAAAALAREAMEARTRIDVFESAFRRIKEATGVSDVNEVRPN